MYAPNSHNKKKEVKEQIYRSNSSLDLIYSEHQSNGLRQYGSHGSIDVIGGANDKYPNMVLNYANNTVNQSISTPNFSRNLQRHENFNDAFTSLENVDGPIPKPGTSPKLRLKFHKFWGSNGQSLKQMPLDDGAISSINDSYTHLGCDNEDQKRKSFAHYDCQSLVANLGYAAKLRSVLLSRRRNTTTGASAASMLQARNADVLAAGEPGPDLGDGCSNDLVESCPFFRNEIGGEEERCVSLSWKSARCSRADRNRSFSWHRPSAAYGLSLLEYPPGQTHWRHSCPFSRTSHSQLPIESQDIGALYYRKYFYGQDHQNWFGLDDQLGPVAISIKKERVELAMNGHDNRISGMPNTSLVWQYRLIIRTSELLTLRGSVLEDAIATLKPSNNSKNYNTKDIFDYVAPEVQLSCLRLGITGGGAEEQLLRLDEQCLTRHYKVGIMYCKKDQATEEEMYNNQEAGPAFIEFLQSLGQTVRLKGFDKYKAGLDNKSDSTGLYSVYTTHQDCEIMFHVSTMLPYTPNNRQQLLRKRHIGNDIVTIVFQESGAQPFTPKYIRSQFQHVFIIVKAINPCTDSTHYSIAVSRSKEVPIFGPPIKESAMYPKGEAFTELLLSKVINGENAAIQSPKFSTMATRTRQEYLKDLAKNYVTATTLDTGQKFSIFSSLLMKSGATPTHSMSLRSEPSPSEYLVGGALCFMAAVQDEGAGGTVVDCFLGISRDTLVLVEETTRQIVLVVPTKSLLGWVVSSGGWVRVYYHRGECVSVRAHTEPLLRRLHAVAPASAALLAETVLTRSASGQLGFHVQADGLVTAVEAGGTAGRAGVRRGARLLEVCRAAVATLHHDQLVDLLKTSDPVTVTMTMASVGCECRLSEEECGVGAGAGSAGGGVGRGDAQLPGRQRRAYDRSFSPPRSSDSSGYGTGGSGRSARRSPEGALEPGGEVASRRHSHDDAVRRDAANSPRRATPKRASARPSSGVGSLQEELMKLIDPAALEESQVATARPAAVVGGRTLPLPDPASLDWPALVRTATRAMLQICEEHQFPSIEAAESASECAAESSPEWREPEPAVPVPVPAAAVADGGASCECGLAARVAALEANAAHAARQRHELETEVCRLRRQNARLREESARAVRQLRRFTEWFKHTVDRQN